MKADASTVIAVLSWNVEMEKKHTVIQVAHEVVQRCNMVAVKHAKWAPDSLGVIVLPLDRLPGVCECAMVSLSFICKGGKGGWKKRIPSIAIRSGWWIELSTLIDAPRNGTISWLVVGGESDKSTAMDTFAELDRALGGK